MEIVTNENPKISMEKPKTVKLCSDFGSVSAEPTMFDEGTGIRFDFNCGFRCKLPDGLWDMQIFNAETGDCYVHELMPGGTDYMFPFRYYIPFQVRIENKTAGKLFSHTMNLSGRPVAFKMMQRTLGDPIYMLAAVFEFERKHQCKAIIYGSKRINEIFRDQYPHIDFRELVNEQPDEPYATYYLGLFFDQNRFWQPYDFRTYSLIQQAQHILGLDDFYILPPPKIKYPETKDKSRKKYCTISFTGSKQCKFWNNPRGWYDTVIGLRDLGYDVICIDKDPIYGQEPYINILPPGVIDMTGERPLQERIDLIANGDFFIGMASGLAALAWCCTVPVVMISGFSLPFAEFPCYRVINPMSECKGCWNDTRIDFSHHEMHWCPRVDSELKALNGRLMSNQNTAERDSIKEQMRAVEAKRFICTKSITPNMVLEEVRKIIKRIG